MAKTLYEQVQKHVVWRSCNTWNMSSAFRGMRFGIVVLALISLLVFCPNIIEGRVPGLPLRLPS